MAHSLSSKKRIRQNAKNAARNRWRLRNMRVAIKEFTKALTSGTNQEAQDTFKKLARVIDRTAQKGVIHKNQAARRKSRLTKRLKAKIGAATA